VEDQEVDVRRTLRRIAEKYVMKMGGGRKFLNVPNGKLWY
jgi:hypothetical protein